MLFGSYTSIVIVKKNDFEIKKKLSKILLKILFEYNIYISVKAIAEDEYELMKKYLWILSEYG